MPAAPDNLWKNSAAETIISNLRAEVSTQKACITQYSLQAVGFAAVAWGLVLKIDRQDALYESVPIYLCGTIIVFMFLVVVRMANHKYSTVNRNLGYELHLCRLKDYSRIGSGKEWARKKWVERMLNVGWEEAMCAWRFVQPSIFYHLYGTSPILRQHRTKEPYRSQKNAYHWYDTSTLLSDGATYEPGTYLRNIHHILHSLGGFSLFIMWGFLFYHVNQHRAGDSWVLVGAAVVTVAITAWFVVQINRQGSHRRILENEALSIQSNAVVWRIVVTCHILAVEHLVRQEKGYKLYTRYTSALGMDFTKHFPDPHSWLADWERLMDSETVYHKLEALLASADTDFIAKPRIDTPTDYPLAPERN